LNLVFLISCILLFILGILYEGIRQLRQYFEEEHLFNKKMLVYDKIIDFHLLSIIEFSIPDNTNEFELEPMSNNPANKPVPTKSSLQFSTRIWLSGFYVINLAFSYVFMLVIMTFNIYLFISIVLGIGTGYGFYTLISLVPSKNKNKNSI